MKLAEALIERADLQSKVENLRYRMVTNAKVQEGLNPNENPVDLLKELNELTTRLEYLIIHINKTNENTNVENETLSSLIAKRDVLNKKLSILTSMQQSASELVSRVSHSEIKIVPTFNVANMQKQIFDLSKDLRLLDTKIQSINWTVDLV